MTVARIGIVTVSDRASAGVYEDQGGPAIREFLAQHLTSAWDPVARVISDDVGTIARTLRDLADLERCCLIVTTGSTRSFLSLSSLVNLSVSSYLVIPAMRIFPMMGKWISPLLSTR